MSGDQAYYYNPISGLPFLIPIPTNQVPPPHPSPSSLATPQTPEPAPLGSFQNPYPANSVVPLTIPPSTSTQYAPATAPSYDPTHRTQTVEILVQYFQFIPLLCRCDDISEDQQGDTASPQNYNHVSSNWWSAPPTPSPSETQQQQTVMACTHCGEAVGFHAGPPTAASTTTNPTLSPPTPYSQPQPQTHPPPSTNPNPTDNSTTPTAPSARARLAATAFFDPQDRNLDYEFEPRKWADCHVCNDKPALREKEGVLFCLGCWAEAERAEVEMEMERER